MDKSRGPSSLFAMTPIEPRQRGSRRKSKRSCAGPNADLEQFAYTATISKSRRTVKVFSELLARRSREKLDDQSLEFLKTVVSVASRMEALLGDLLAYTHTMRLENPAEAFARINSPGRGALQPQRSHR
jgi:light-regulated signal transduction histidine kinase (bacteriophytochrome)